MIRRFPLVFGTLVAASAVIMAWALRQIFLVAPEERVMGAVQKIFYIHVPIAAITFLAVFVLLVGALGYLATRKPVWDHLAVASCEVGWVFCTLVLITGPIWAKPAWGVWWTWEAKITTTLVLWLLLAGIVLARGYATTQEQAARVGAVLGVVAALDVPIVYKAVDWWRGQHPIVFGPGRGDPLAPGMGLALGLGFLGVTILFAALVVLRMRLAALEDSLAAAEDAAWRPS
jgi:heme exporter protein C